MALTKTSKTIDQASSVVVSKIRIAIIILVGRPIRLQPRLELFDIAELLQVDHDLGKVASRKRIASIFLISVLNCLRARDTGPVTFGSVMQIPYCAVGFMDQLRKDR